MCVPKKSSNLFVTPGISDLEVMAGFLRRHCTAEIYDSLSVTLRVRLDTGNQLGTLGSANRKNSFLLTIPFGL